MTCSGRFVAMANLIIGIEEVLVAKIAFGFLDERVELAKDVNFEVFVLRDGFDHHLPVAQRREVLTENQVAPREVCLILWQLARTHRTLQ